MRFLRAVVTLFGALPMKETDKEYYTRRGAEERKRARTATMAKNRWIHSDLSDLCHERANGSANVNGKTGIESANPKAARSGDI
jgi:hypothetical protein